FGIGADGLMVLGDAPGYDFSMLYWNADGRPGSMCGNGARCIVAFAHRLGIERDRYRFLAPDGMHEAFREADGTVRLRMSDVGAAESVDGDHFLDTGSPHYVRFTGELDALDVDREGRAIRHSSRFEREGVNVNFVQRLEGGGLFVRTFERGVEAETMSCGTGVTASALVSTEGAAGRQAIAIKTLGGRLRVDFDAVPGLGFRNIWLVGPATFVYIGEVDTEDIKA
ncbi:MAG: diaminopimelate epimerase, partial [Chitinophagia bacterium]|nr:diaminopimelate epimerase [Chitinophagia bacterium]